MMKRHTVTLRIILSFIPIVRSWGGLGLKDVRMRTFTEVWETELRIGGNHCLIQGRANKGGTKMGIILQPISDETRSALDRWKQLRNLILEVHAVASKATSRIDRANRLRTESSAFTTVKDVAMLSAAAGYESDAYKHFSALPSLFDYFHRELLTAREQLDGGES